MKKFFALMVLLTVAMSLQAQKCDYAFNEKGQKKMMVSISRLVQFWLNNDNGQFSLGLELTYADIRKEKIMKGDSLILIIGETDFVILTAREEAQPVGKANENVELTNYYPIYDISPAVAEKLSRNAMTAMKVFFGRDFNMVELESKKAKKIMDAATCVRQ